VRCPLTRFVAPASTQLSSHDVIDAASTPSRRSLWIKNEPYPFDRPAATFEAAQARTRLKQGDGNADPALAPGDSDSDHHPPAPALALRGKAVATTLPRDAALIGSSDASQSAVSWASIFAGAVVAIATTLILVAIGSGLGFAAASPWPGSGPSGTTFAIGVGVWLIVTQWLSSALGGYITGRLRTKWTGIHTHEVMFRDTAHGLLAWAVATAVVAAVAMGATTSLAGATSSAAATAVDNATDTLLRSVHPGTDATSAAARAEITRLLNQGSDVKADDKSYLTNEVAAQTGLSPAEAQQRVDAAVTSIRESADKARKASSALSFFTALSMLIGAFIACVAAAYAGDLRDKHGDIVSRA
jgi:hypothetical protein